MLDGVTARGGHEPPEAANNTNTSEAANNINTNVRIWVPSKRVSGSTNSDLQSWTSSKRISSEYSISKLMQDLQPQSDASLTLRPEIEQALTASREGRKKVRIGSREAGPNFDVKLGDVKLGNEVSIQRTSSHAESSPTPKLTEEQPKEGASEIIKNQSPEERFIARSQELGVNEGMAENGDVKKLSAFIEANKKEWDQMAPGEVKTFRRQEGGTPPLTVEVFKSEGQLHIMVTAKTSKQSISDTAAKKIQGGSKIIKPAIEWTTGSLWVKHTSSKLADREEIKKEFHDENKMYSKLKGKPGIALPIIAIHEYEGHNGARIAAYQPFANKGNLKDYLAKSQSPSTQTNEIMGQLAEGLATLTTENLLHDDLKLGNILVQEDSGKATAGIADLGGLIELPSESDHTFLTKYATGGTPSYLSPEKDFVGKLLTNARTEKKLELVKLFGLEVNQSTATQKKEGRLSGLRARMELRRSRSLAEKKLNQFMQKLPENEKKELKIRWKIPTTEKIPPFKNLPPLQQKRIIDMFAQNYAVEYFAPLEKSIKANGPAAEMWAMGLIFAALTSTKKEDDIIDLYNNINEQTREHSSSKTFDFSRPILEQYNDHWAKMKEGISSAVENFIEKGNPDFETRALIKEMLAVDPQRRPSPTELRDRLPLGSS